MYPSVMLEYSSRCNLRCKYCTKSAEGDDLIPGRDQDMTEADVEKILQFLRSNPVSELLLAGTGETTVAKRWTEDIPLLIEAARNLNASALIHLNSNFARRFTNDELAVIQQLDRVNVSIDTDDYDLTKSLRAKSSLSDIFFNIIKLKSFCFSRNLESPTITIVSVVTADTFQTLPSLIYTLSLLPIDEIVLCDLMETQATIENLICGFDNSATSMSETVDQIDASVKFLQQATNIKLNLQPAFRQSLTEAISSAGVNSPKSEKNTKICTQPWTRFTISADHQIFPCCVTDMSSVGPFDWSQDAQVNFNNPMIRDFRRKLLIGDPPTPCKKCSNAPNGTTHELMTIVGQISSNLEPELASFRDT